MKDGIYNAAIIDAAIEVRDFYLSVRVRMDCGDYATVKFFGGYPLYVLTSNIQHELLSPMGHFIWRLMEVAEVKEWSELKGKTVRIEVTDGVIYSIGHIIRTNWFHPIKDFNWNKKDVTEQSFINTSCILTTGLLVKEADQLSGAAVIKRLQQEAPHDQA
ncbi:MAG: hypothetical protein LBU89_03740 [Fibromonadaceae bacterium]|jgi:hypothetical protein|nr:hypothetical protein [Fibromonadaceae bacterium]